MSSKKAGSGLALERLVFFSDAVFAIAITLLVLEIRFPELPSDASDLQIGRALLHTVPKIIGFVVSFLVIAAYWEGHHRMFSFVERLDRGIVWRNMLLLLTVSFMPFPTALFSEYPARGLSLRFYSVCLALVGVCTATLWRHAVRRGLLVAGVAPMEIRRVRNRALATPVVCGLAAALSYVSLPVSRTMLVLIPIAVGIGDRLARRK